MRRTTNERAWHDIYEARIKGLTQEKAERERLVDEAVLILTPLAEHDAAVFKWLAQVAMVVKREAP